MGKIRVKTLGDEQAEKQQAEKAKARREQKKSEKEKSHIKGVGLKGGQQIKMVEGVELAPEIEKLLQETPVEETAKKPKKKFKVKQRSQKYLKAQEMVDKNKYYELNEALELLGKTSITSFDGSVDAHINLNAFTLGKDKNSLSGSVNFPHSTGKKRVIRIADDELLKQLEQGKIDFDVLVAHPTMMPKLAKYAKILGPRGLMPNPKNQTVTADPEKRAKELAGGETAWKTEPDHPLIHISVGKVSHPPKNLSENIKALASSVGREKISKVTLSTTMGPGIKVELNSF
jgi:large subunit ribosomal protein L1